MRISKKFFVLFFFLSVSTVNAGWYDNTPVHYSNGSMTSCPADGDTAGGTPTGYPHDTAITNNSSSTTPTPVYNTYSLNSNHTNATTVGRSGTMYCLKWDGSDPTGTITYYDGWTNDTSQTINFTHSDHGGAGFKDYTVQFQEASDTPGFTSWGSWQDLCTGTTGTSCSKNLQNGKAYKFRILLNDDAGNSQTITSGNIIKVDTVSPVLADVSNHVPTNILATNSYSYSLSVSNASGSPIIDIEGDSENTNSPTSTTSRTSTNHDLNFSWNMSKVDNYITGNGSRIYTFKLTKICDEAGNCWNGSNGYNHNVYANTTNITTKDVTTSNPLNHSTIADGSPESIVINLSDTYGNAIIPASGIGRTVDFNYHINNSLYLNQYGQSGVSAIQISGPSNPASYTAFPIGTNVLKTFNAQPSLDGTYTFNVKSYAPTYNEYNKTHNGSNLTINSITFDVNRTTSIVGGDNPTGVSVNGGSGIVAHFKPLYTTQLAGDIDTNGFIEGSVQNSTVTLSKTVGGRDASNQNIYLEFGSGARQSVTSFDLYYSPTGSPSTQMVEGNQGSLSFTPYITNFVSQVYTLKTKLTQALGIPYSGLEKIYLASLIKYTLDGYVVSYPTDVINKTAYFDDTTTGSGNQAGVKILGITASENNNELISGQFTQDISILGNIYKTNLKKDIIANVYNLIKSITPSNGSNTITNLSSFASNSDGKKLSNNTILYFGGLSGADVILGNGNENVSGVKTIVIVGGNLYIKNNMFYNDKNNDILGVVVLKDENGNGGNLYIDPSVTNIVGTYILDKSVISYDGSSELDGNTDQSVLKNQLHIFGSVFSENTLGGSRSSPIKCPYYVASTSCDQTTAQKYDLNYLRRFMLNAQMLPISNGKVIGGGTCTDPVSKSCTGGNGAFARNIINTSDTYAKYPVVIEYNPLISTSFPPLFSQ